MSDDFDFDEWAKLEIYSQGQARQMAKDIKILQDRLDRQDDVLQRIKNWAKAYPLSIFPPPDYPLCHKTLKTVNQTVDAISADCQRHLLESITNMIQGDT